MRYKVKNKKRDTYIQEPFSERIIKTFKEQRNQVSVMSGTNIRIVDYGVTDTEEITIYVEVV